MTKFKGFLKLILILYSTCTSYMDLIEHFSFCPEPLCIVIEFVSGGSLDKILRDSHVQTQSGDPAYTNIWSNLTERELLSIASDVANGMKHLESKQVSRTMALHVRTR